MEVDDSLERLSPLETFNRYLPEKVFEDMALATSQRILSNTAKNVCITPLIMKKFIAANILMSYTKYPRIRMYWARKPRVAQIADHITRDMFFQIRSNLTTRNYLYVTEDEKNTNKFWKIAPVIDSVRRGCLENPRCQDVSMDEQMIPFHGQTRMRQYVRGKPNPVGLKNFVATAPDGLPLDFFLYQGKGDTVLEVDPNCIWTLEVRSF